MLAIDCDILAPAAIESVITIDNADKIKARMVFELANGPTTCESHHILEDKGIIIVPDILANAGGVVVSFFEWLQNKHGEDWDRNRVDIELKKRMCYATERMMAQHFEHKISMKIATYTLALKRIASANESLGNKGYFQH